METQDIHSLIKHLEAASSLDAALAAAVHNAVCPIGAGDLTLPADGGLFSTDEVIHLIDEALPEWSIKLTGRASNINGHWVCTLRQSEVRDNDEVIGIGQSAVLAHALLAALLKVIDGRPREV
ncbi:hypothetical protein K3556_15185 [Aliiroseovarius sp. M344]|uniref:hypothetical protein n=1 Tax=Aliiroseovarius sp. M344 TaxID=2867010 RepID=UPI0021ADDFEE|nr:hypothetical protein [Aliiroseovarius sp. M344]UWQ14231.1 hypothetical protein K3556_15185 [Aliiroseovarius sp. M344]